MTAENTDVAIPWFLQGNLNNEIPLESEFPHIQLPHVSGILKFIVTSVRMLQDKLP